MNHIEVKSSNLKSVAYTPDGEIMTVRFRCPECKGEGNIHARGFDGEPSGEPCAKRKGQGHTGNYHFAKVPQETYAKLLAAPSPGSAFHQLIRGKYEATRDEEPA